MYYICYIIQLYIYIYTMSLLFFKNKYRPYLKVPTSVSLDSMSSVKSWFPPARGGACKPASEWSGAPSLETIEADANDSKMPVLSSAIAVALLWAWHWAKKRGWMAGCSWHGSLVNSTIWAIWWFPEIGVPPVSPSHHPFWGDFPW